MNTNRPQVRRGGGQVVDPQGQVVHPSSCEVRGQGARGIDPTVVGEVQQLDLEAGLRTHEHERQPQTDSVAGRRFGRPAVSRSIRGHDAAGRAHRRLSP